MLTMTETPPDTFASQAVEERLRNLSLALSSLAEEAVECGLHHAYALLRQARLALIEEAAQRHGITL
jgi:hypothetical protein